MGQIKIDFKSWRIFNLVSLEFFVGEILKC